MFLTINYGQIRRIMHTVPIFLSLATVPYRRYMVTSIPERKILILNTSSTVPYDQGGLF